MFFKKTIEKITRKKYYLALLEWHETSSRKKSCQNLFKNVAKGLERFAIVVEYNLFSIYVQHWTCENWRKKYNNYWF